MALTIAVRKTLNVTVLEISGQMTAAEPVDQLRETMRGLLAEEHRLFLLDLSRVPYMDSTGLGQTLTALASAANRGGHLALLSPSAQIRHLLQIIKLQTVDVYDDEAVAVDAMMKKRGTTAV